MDEDISSYPIDEDASPLPWLNIDITIADAAVKSAPAPELPTQGSTQRDCR
jgi:hypothetical protein